MRTKNYTSIVEALTPSGITGSTGFGPTIDNVVVFSDYLNRSSAGNFIKKPMLVGMQTMKRVSSVQRLPLRAWLPKFQTYIGIIPTSLVSLPCCSQSEHFSRKRSPDMEISMVRGISQYNHHHTVPDSGAWHASELPILFNNTPSGPGIPVGTPQEIAIGSYLRGAWATFAKDPVNGLSTYSGSDGTGWPTYVPGQNTLVRLAYQNLTGPNLAPSEMYDSQCNVTFIVPPSASAKKSEGGRREMSFGLLFFLGALIFAL
jgi:cholinesterase